MIKNLKQIVALTAFTVVSVSAYAQTNTTAVVKNSGDVKALTSTVNVGYQNYNIDRGVKTLDDSAFADIKIAAPLFAGFDGLANVKYAASSADNDEIGLTGGLGTNLKLGDFEQYMSLTFTKRVSSPLESYEADLSFRFTHLPVPYVNKLFTPVLTLAKTWSSDNKGLITGVTRSDTFKVFGKSFELDNSAVYGHFDDYKYVQLNSELSTKLVGNVNLVGGVNYVNDLSGGDFNRELPYYVGASVKF